MERDFKGVWIPKEIWLNEDLNWTEKLLYIEIDSLARNGECFAMNDHFAKFLRISKDRVSKMITSLNRKGLVSVELIYKKGTKEIEKRIIKTNPIGENADTPRQEHLDPIGENAYTPIGENTYDNNTSINNTFINTIKINKKINKKEKSAELEMEFETLWKAYPRKEGKTAAKKHYIKARKNKTSYETVENGLYRYKEYLEQQGTDSQFIPYGSSWFCQERWNDEYICIATKNQPLTLMDMYRRDFGGSNDEPKRNTSIFDYNESGISECISQSEYY